jgi:hypothetical protein
MKKILFLSILIFFISCSKTKNKKNISGTWNISEFYNSYQTPSYSGDTTVYNIGSLTFNNDGTGNSNTTAWGNETFNWSNDKENIYLESNNNIDTFKIIEISKNKIILTMHESGMSSSGLENYNYKYTLTK